MAGKSIQDILRQMQAQRVAENQARIAREKAIFEQRERSRQEYLKQIRMFEKLAPTSASSAAAGAGGSIRNYPTVVAEHWVISWVDTSTDTWKLRVNNFTSGQLSDEIDTGLTYDTGNEWSIWNDEYAVSEMGHSIVFSNNMTNNFKIFFINSNGQLIATKDLNTSEDFQYTENAEIFLGELNGVSTCYHFDGANVRTHQFPDVDISLIEVDDGQEDDVTADGSIIIEAPNNVKYYIARPSGDLIDISTDMLNLNSFLIDYNTDFIYKIDNDSDIKVISQEGELKNTLDLTGHSITSVTENSIYGDNCAFSILNSSASYKLFVSYDGDSNQFITYTYSTDLQQSYGAYENNWGLPNPSYGKTLTLSTYQTTTTGTIGFDVTGLEIRWIPKGSNDFEVYTFSAGTVSYIDGLGYFTGDRVFGFGENPITMFSFEGGPIQVGFLNSTGFVTQSTGVISASCSNVWGRPIGDRSFAVFDVGADRVWQIYGTNSIESETTTGSNWTWGSSTNDVHRNGTLAVLDLNDGSKSFIWTSEIGLTSGPTGYGSILNDVNSGNRTGLSTEYQIITRFVYGEEINSYIQGFYLLSKSGLSDFVDCFAGLTSSYQMSSYKIGTDLFSIYFTDAITSFVRVQNYKLPNLELIDDYNPGLDSGTALVSLYKNRCLITETSGSTKNIRFVGKHGVNAYSINFNDYNAEANDIQDND
jgi:hypothetical protein